MKYFILLCLVTHSLWAETRGSVVNLTFTGGPDDYKSQSVDGAIGINDEWQIIGSYFRSDSGVAQLADEPLVSTEGRIGLDWSFHSSWNVFGEVIGRKDPYELVGQGGSLGFGVNISDYWKSKKRTRLSFLVQQIKFRQDITFVGARASLNVSRAVDQKLATVSLSQEIIDWLELGLNVSRYNYEGESDKLALATGRRRTSLGGSGPTYGLPDRAASIRLTLTLWDFMETSLIGSHTKILPEGESETKTQTIEQLFFWKDWTLGAQYISSTYTNNASGSDPSTQTFFGVILGYSW